ncbi:Asp-tRNA(Asn)/Glu-tRNA(Gln) amidotransferase subunit GatA [Patescibacteria group bacterium]
MNLNTLTISDIQKGLSSKEFSALELTKAYLAHMSTTDSKVKAFITVMEKEAKTQAEEIDKQINDKKELNALAGVPIAVKDNILIKNIRATAASHILDQYQAPYDATVIRYLRNAGTIFLGKTNLDEFAMGTSTENSAYQKTKNPWDLTRVPGGSSGGSVAAVSASMAPIALGSDTGGSIRQPAALCGVVGMKPTYGRVSRNGLIAMTSSFDQIGPIAKSVRDAALLFSVISGKDRKDVTTVDKPLFNISDIEKDISGKVIGVPKEFFVEGMDANVEKTVKKAISQLEELGATIKEISLPHSKYAIAVYTVTVTSEISTNLARYDGVRYGLSVSGSSLLDSYFTTREKGFGDEPKRRIILGTFALSKGYYEKYYFQAQKVRAIIRKEFEDVFKNVDCIVSSTTPTTAFKIGEKIDDPLALYLEDILTAPANIADLPGISLPCGFVDDLPVGLQIIGKHYDEQTMFQVAHAYEQATEWHTKGPKL